MLRKKKGEINGHLRIKKDNKIIKVKKKKKNTFIFLISFNNIFYFFIFCFWHQLRYKYVLLIFIIYFNCPIGRQFSMAVQHETFQSANSPSWARDHIPQFPPINSIVDFLAWNMEWDDHHFLTLFLQFPFKQNYSLKRHSMSFQNSYALHLLYTITYLILQPSPDSCSQY